MSQSYSLSVAQALKYALASILSLSLLLSVFGAHAASTTPETPIAESNNIVSNTATTNTAAVTTTTATTVRPVTTTDAEGRPTLATQMQPTDKALSAANQQLLSRNAQLQREVNDLQTQANVLVYESQGQLFLYGAFTVLISLLVGIFISWLVFVRRERW